MSSAVSQKKKVFLTRGWQLPMSRVAGEAVPLDGDIGQFRGFVINHVVIKNAPLSDSYQMDDVRFLPPLTPSMRWRL
jgi:hypothetical protein